MATPIHSPLSYYLREGKQLHKNNVQDCLKKITDSVAINRAENAKTVAEYNKYCNQADDLSKKIRSKKTARGWSIAGIVIVALVGSIVFGCMEMMDAVKAMLISVCVIGAIVGIILVCKKFRKIIDELTVQFRVQEQLAEKELQKANAQAQPLNDAFPEYISLRLVEKTMPTIAFDDIFTAERLQQLTAQGLNGAIEENESVLETLSGELYGKPFLYERRLKHYVGEKTYHGSLTIHWTTRERDSKGNYSTRHHSQTLHASVTKPYPEYVEYTRLHYAHDALPNLNFSRSPKFSDDKSEAQLEREICKGERKLRRLEEKELKNGGDYTQMENTEFEVLFGATNRTDELEFRQMYSVQAQRNIVELLLSDETYGDDFSYIKNGKIHTIANAHSQDRSLYLSASAYRSHDISVAERAFVELNEEFYKDVFFDFAPILAVPLLQDVQESTAIQTGGKTRYNYEEYANCLEGQLRPNRCDTRCILKIESEERKGQETHLGVCASGYYGVDRVDYISKLGGDGCWHDVPVDWTDYIPEQRESVIKIVSSEDAIEKNNNARKIKDVYAFVK